MFVRLLICVGFLACLCLGLVGCEDEDPQIIKEVAQLVETVPASGERAAAHQPVVLYFDKAPLAVTVNGTAARVEGNSAIWSFPKPPPYGDGLFHIEWTNPDGSPNAGTDIRLMVIADVAKLVKTLPASRADTADHLPLVLYFDKEPLAVTVNGTAARVEGKSAVWCFPNPVEKLGDQLFHIKWTNPDGSSNIGAFIRLTVFTPGFSLPSILAGSFDGSSDVDPDPLNRDGIWFEYDEPVVGLKAKLLTVEGEDLGWEAVWDDRTVKFLPGVNGRLLENGKSYLIQMVVAEAWIYNDYACDCMDCSHFESIDRTIRFRTVAK